MTINKHQHPQHIPSSPTHTITINTYRHNIEELIKVISLEKRNFDMFFAIIVLDWDVLDSSDLLGMFDIN